jgi:hypothetical protein
MSMYAELLAISRKSLRAPDQAPHPEADPLERVVACRARLNETSVVPEDDELLGDLAANIDYDLALIDLCESKGIDSDPVRFARPLDERRRLERALVAAGVSLGSLAESVIRLPPSEGRPERDRPVEAAGSEPERGLQEPPVGST